MNNVIVIGGGAAGLIAAIVSARNGAEVIILEKMNRVGKKILATGNGRCNFTNSNCEERYYHSNNQNFVLGALNRFTYEDTINFFNDLGIQEKQEKGGKYYPYSDQATSILEVLRYEIKRLNIQEICDTEVIDIKKSKNNFIIKTNNKNYSCKKIILATGGKSSPQLGSNGTGYKILMKFGHKLITPFPALVQIKLNSSFLKRISGVKFIGNAKVLNNNKILREEEGEILFTNYGISGPPILQISRKIGECSNKKCFIQLDLFPKYEFNDLFQLLLQRIQNMRYKTLQESFIGLLNKRLIPVIINEAGLEINEKCNSINKKQINAIVKILKEWSIPVSGLNTWQQSQVTAGGINTKDVNPVTFESKIIKNLYIVGEVLDVDGDCGGYNLQWAWSSGYLAGLNAAIQK